MKICENKKQFIKKHNKIIDINYTFLYIYIDDNDIKNQIKILIYVSQIKATRTRYLKNNEHYIVYFKKFENINITCEIIIDITFSIFII